MSLMRGAAAPLTPLSLAEVARRRAARAGGWPVGEGPTKWEGTPEGQDPLVRGRAR